MFLFLLNLLMSLGLTISVALLAITIWAGCYVVDFC